nr:tRNA lysidine(34) synthetase TilS [Saprospiraceae bacterium]
MAVSGGIDSVVLAHLMLELGYRIALIHVNYGLRGKDSDKDEQFVRSLAGKLDVEVFIKRFCPHPDSLKKGIQEKAREFRYRWFQQVAEEKKYKFILTAHHLEDSTETVLLNLFRGTGPRGMRGIQPIRGIIRRPLLECSRNKIEKYAVKHGIKWREDRTNSESNYTRNFLRNEILPTLKKRWPQLDHTLQSNAAIMSEMDRIQKFWIQRELPALTTKEKDLLMIDLKKMRNSLAPVTLLRAALRDCDFSREVIDDILKVKQAGRQWFSPDGKHVLTVEPMEKLSLRPVDTLSDISPIEIKRGTTQVETPQGTLVISKVNKISKSSDKSVAFIVADQLKFPLVLRPWQAGEVFQPLGMKGKHKKIKSYLSDLKLGKRRKKQILVLASQKEVIWVVGLRIDERFAAKIKGEKKGEYYFFRWREK